MVLTYTFVTPFPGFTPARNPKPSSNAYRTQSFKIRCSLDARFRYYKDVWLNPIAKHTPLSPMQITCLSLFAGIACCVVAASRQNKFVILGLWVLNRVLDGLDGVVARSQGTQSDLGGLFDMVCDMIVYSAIPIGLVLGVDMHFAYPKLWIALSFLLAVYHVNNGGLFMLSSILEKRNASSTNREEQTSVTMCDSLIGGTETVFVYSLMIWLANSVLGLTSIFWIFGTLVAMTTIRRMQWAYKNLK